MNEKQTITVSDLPPQVRGCISAATGKEFIEIAYTDFDEIHLPDIEEMKICYKITGKGIFSRLLVPQKIINGEFSLPMKDTVIFVMNNKDQFLNKLITLEETWEKLKSL